MEEKTKKKFPAFERLSNGIKIIDIGFICRCPYCKNRLIQEYSFDISNNLFICENCEKIFMGFMEDKTEELKRKGIKLK